MTTRSELEALLERLEMATGDSKPFQLDMLACDLHAALVAQIPKGFARGSASGRYLIAHAGKGGVWAEEVPPYLTSIDAAVALIGRVNPAWTWSGGSTAEGAWAVINMDRAAIADTDAPTPALALCKALVRAKLAEIQP